jgi:teichuronic acid biosynthesis glycosyltransferase TuaH
MGSDEPSAWREFVVIVGATVWNSTHLSDQEIARHLSAWIPVLYVDPPVSHLTARRVPAVAASLAGPRLRMEGPRLARTTPVVPPGKSRPVMREVTGVLLRRHLRATVASLGGGRVRAMIAMTPDHRVLGSCDEDISVHWVKDDYVAGADLLGLPAGRVRRGEMQTTAAADLVVACSPAIADQWRRLGASPLLVPNGVDPDHYAQVETLPPAGDVRLEGPIAGFVGTMSSRIDLSLLERVADDGMALLLVGARQHTFRSARFDELLERDNVQWVGARPYAELPSYLAAMDVGLLPYEDSAFNRASFPLKVLEYLAAGRGVVATDLPAVRWLETDLVRIASSADEFADAVRALARDREPRSAEARRAVARRHGWSERVATFARAIGLDG